MKLLPLLALPLLLGADPRPPLPAPPPLEALRPDWDGDDIDDYLDRMHAHSLNAVERVLHTSRPRPVESPERHLALLTLDEALHYDEPDSNASPAVIDFLRRRIEVAADELRRTRVREGTVIWKLYDHAFVVRTPSATLAFDLTRTYFGMAEPDARIEAATRRVARECDALFISHVHGDHYDPWVVDLFTSSGKPVLAPENVDPGNTRITRPPRDGTTWVTVKLSDIRQVQVLALPGYQGDLPNNVYIARTSEAFTMAHTGDLFTSRSTPEDSWRWIDSLARQHDVGVLMVNVWTTDFPRVIRGFDPDLVLTGHENEMGHDPLKRKTNYLAYDRFQSISQPRVLMTWGESYWLQP